MISRRRVSTWLTIFLLALLASFALVAPNRKVEAQPATRLSNNLELGMYWRPAPNFDLNLSRALANTRQATSQQLVGVEQLRSTSNSSRMQVRWNDFGGSPDVISGFASAPFSGTPEAAGRAFLAANAAAF